MNKIELSPMEKIFFDNQDKLTGRYLVVDEDEYSIWVGYVL